MLDKMEILSIVLGILTILFLGVVVSLNTMNSTTAEVAKKTREGFEDVGTEPQIATQIRAVLDPMAKGHEELCSLYGTIRNNMLKNEKTGTNLSDAQAKQKVEQTLAVKIPGGTLPCPILQYPRSGSSELEWLAFLQRLPSDFGARIVLMAVYARDSLQSTAQGLKDALSGKGKLPADQSQEAFQEPFAPICPPDVASTRRAELAKKGKLESECVLPENADAASIQSQVTTLLQKLVAEKTNVLKSKDIDPLINIQPLLQEAKVNQAYLEKQAEDAESGNLAVAIPS